MTIEKAYAVVKWIPADVQTLRPSWSLEQCEDFLQRNENKMADRLTELGWDVIDTYLSMEEPEPRDDDGFIQDVPNGWATKLGETYLGTHATIEQAEDSVRLEGERSNFTPNVWRVSDHGNHHLIENFWEPDIKATDDPEYDEAERQEQERADRGN